MIIELNEEIFDTLNSLILSKKYFINEKKYNPYARFLAIVYKNEIIGYLYYSIIYDRAEINQFEIKKEYRKQGLGTKLLTKMLESENIDITLEVNENNNDAISLYKKFGFKQVGLRKSYYDGEDGLLMQRKIIE